MNRTLNWNQIGIQAAVACIPFMILAFGSIRTLSIKQADLRQQVLMLGTNAQVAQNLIGELQRGMMSHAVGIRTNQQRFVTLSNAYNLFLVEFSLWTSSIPSPQIVFITTNSMTFTNTVNAESIPSLYEHQFTIWSDPVQAEGNFIIPQWYQWRHCTNCPAYESRKVK